MTSDLRDFSKAVVDAAALFVTLPLYLFYLLSRFFALGDQAFWDISQLLSLLPGLPGDYLRKGFYRLAMTRCERQCAIHFGTVFAQADTEIGKGVYVGPHCNIGMCRIEDDCTLGSGVHVVSGRQQHRFDDLDVPIREQGGFLSKVVIGQDTWVGNGAIIMASVGRKCVVGAGSVVTHDVEDLSVVAGNPARLIRKRS